MEGHAVHDDASYVPKQMLEEWARRDPIEQYRSWLGRHASLTAEEDQSLEAEVSALLQDALRRADASPIPDGSTVTDGVYAELSDLPVDAH
jgi:TPP-dependent pyruvate/acetoin dehydrogenase alpha subunit